MLKTIRSSTARASLAGFLCIGLVLTTTVGCDQQKTIAALAQTLGSASASVAALEGNTQLAQQLTTDTAAAVKAVNEWKSGSTADMVIQSLSIVEADLSLIPGTSQYAPLIDIAIATTQSIIALLPAPSNASVNKAVRVRTVHLGHPAPKTAKQFKSEWNRVADSNPGLAPAAIQ